MEVEISKIMPPTEGTTCQPWYFPHSNRAKHIHPPNPFHHGSSSGFHTTSSFFPNVYRSSFLPIPDRLNECVKIKPSKKKKNPIVPAEHCYLQKVWPIAPAPLFRRWERQMVLHVFAPLDFLSGPVVQIMTWKKK